jgi:hypothetical protein
MNDFDVDDVVICQICAGWGYFKTIDLNENEIDVTCSSCLGDGHSRPKVWHYVNETPSRKNKVIELALKAIEQRLKRYEYK